MQKINSVPYSTEEFSLSISRTSFPCGKFCSSNSFRKCNQKVEREIAFHLNVNNIPFQHIFSEWKEKMIKTTEFFCGTWLLPTFSFLDSGMWDVGKLVCGIGPEFRFFTPSLFFFSHFFFQPRALFHKSFKFCITGNLSALVQML